MISGLFGSENPSQKCVLFAYGPSGPSGSVVLVGLVPSGLVGPGPSGLIEPPSALLIRATGGMSIGR